jgi:hypothetical protein
MIDSLPETVVLKYRLGTCEFGFGQPYTMAMITAVLRMAAPTWHMIPTLAAIRCPDNTIRYQTVTGWEPEVDFSEDQQMIGHQPRLMEQRARGAAICSGK